MNELIKKFKPVDIVALVILVIGFILKLRGADGYVSLMLTAIAFYYFGKKGSETLFDQIKCNTDKP